MKIFRKISEGHKNKIMDKKKTVNKILNEASNRRRYIFYSIKY